MGQKLESGLPNDAVSASELRALLRAGVQNSAKQTQIAVAQGITAAAVRGYWNCISPELPLTSPPKEVSAPQDGMLVPAMRMGALLAAVPVAEAAYHLSLLYTALLPPAWRAKHGVFYTPPTLANRLLDQAEAAGLDWKTAQVLDPAAGAGAFLVPAAERMSQAIGACSPAFAIQNLNARIRGYELDPFSAWLSQVFIEAACLPIIKASKRKPQSFISIRDSLEPGFGKNRFDLVVGNPPFGRVSLPLERRDAFSRSLYGHANLYGLFMDLAVRLTKSGGLISFLTPSSFLAGEYFKNLRALMWTEAPPVSLDFVHLRKGVFEDVLQETVLATYRKQDVRGCAQVFFLHPQIGIPAVPEAAGNFTLPALATAPWVLPRHSDEADLAKSLRSMPSRLADWGYKVSTGPLVWNRFKDQLKDASGKKRIPLVWAECISSDGRFIFRSERRNHKPYFSIQPGDDWLIIDKACVLLQRTTAKEQARRLIAAEMPEHFIHLHGAVTVENHLNMLIPIVDKPLVSPALLAVFLNTNIADRAFRCLSGSVAVSAYELENLPLPNCDDLKKLIGRKLSVAAVEAACTSLYAGDGTQ